MSDPAIVDVRCRVNGEEVILHGHPMDRLLDVLRLELRLTGTKEGCGEGECGACSVVVDGALVNSCLMPLLHAEGTAITTIEGLAGDDRLHAVQEAFITHGGAQCGICTPGMVLAAATLLARTPAPTLADVQVGLAGNLCRCTGYTKIFAAVLAAAESIGARGSGLGGSNNREPDNSTGGRMSPSPERRIQSLDGRAVLHAPATLTDALDLLAHEPGVWRPFAGGTDLMVLLEAGMLPPAKYLSLWHLPELRGITVTDDEIVLGALTTYSDVLRSEVLRTECPLLGRAAAETGGVATQNRGTIGGNIANASPAADTPPALFVYDAELDLISVRGVRRVPCAQFHRGYKQMDLAPDEVIHAIRVRRGRGGWRDGWQKVGTRRAQAISKVCFAAAVDVTGDVVRDIRVGVGSVAPTPVRAVQAEAAIRGRAVDAETLAHARDALARDITPIDDLRSTARYRLRVAQNLLAEFLRPGA